jgi:hypothetical protein
MSYAFQEGKLRPIKNPLEPFGSDITKAEQSYGFSGRALFLDWATGKFADEARLAIVGPAEGKDVPYRFCVEMTINNAIHDVWCEDFAALHEYLIYAAPLLTVLQKSAELDQLRDDHEPAKIKIQGRDGS